MNDAFKTWTDAWMANQQNLWKSMVPMPALTAGLGGVGAAGAAGEAAQAPLDEQFKELRDTWQASIEKWTEIAGTSMKAGALTPEALSEIFGPSAWNGAGTGAFDAGLRQVLEGPRYATLWDLDRKLLELQQRAVRRDEAAAAYQGVVQKAWNTAFQRFSTSSGSADAKRPGSWRELTDRWLKVVNDTLVEVHRSDEFLEAQRQLLRSASEYRLQERKIAEAWCEASHIPTRTEIDEMQRTVTELKRQLRALQREKAQPVALSAAKPSRTAAARKQPARRKSPPAHRSLRA